MYLKNHKYWHIFIANKILRLEIQSPGEHYRGSRFDWTGAIVQVTMNDKHTFCTSEFEEAHKINSGGRGFYNEFGIDAAIGYEECLPGQCFHKIGTGMLRRDTKPYHFLKQYDSLPVEIESEWQVAKVVFIVNSTNLNGYAYHLTKSIILEDSSFSINYELKNTGDKAILSNEYVHNFLALNGQAIHKGYTLKLPFTINPESFTETVNPMQTVEFKDALVKWNSEVTEPFFFSNMNSKEEEDYWWELVHEEERIGIRENCYGKVSKVNLWGTRHVVSPEVFHPIYLRPSEKDIWKRTFTFFDL
jgi:hypothetical protein